MSARLAELDMASSTAAGRDWLLKALHPADPSVAGVQLPDGSELDTVPLELTMTYNLSSPAAPNDFTAAWGAQISLLPSIIPLAVYPTDGAINHPAFNLRYPQFSANVPDNDFAILMNSVEALRLTAASVTIHLDANATTDQGTVVACQQVCKPQMMFLTTTAGSAVPPAAKWDYTIPFVSGDVPGYNQIMAMPRAYQANMRDGVYMPLHLANTSQHWYSVREGCSHIDSGHVVTANWKMTLPAVAGNSWPYWSCSSPYINGGATFSPLLCPMLSETVGHIAIANVHQTSGVVIKVRTSLELKVQTQSPYLPYARPAPDLDPVALQSYFRIVRQLDDAYPAVFNDNGKILGYIAKAVRTVAPLLGVVPGWGPLISGAAEPAAKLLEYGAGRLATRGRKRGKKKKNAQTAPTTSTVVVVPSSTTKTTRPKSGRGRSVTVRPVNRS